MPHGNTATWNGEVESPPYVIEWEVGYVSGGSGKAQFTIKEGWRGPHVAQALEKAWNKSHGNTLPAAADGAAVDFAGHVDTMKFKVNNSKHVTLPDDHRTVGVVPGLLVHKD